MIYFRRVKHNLKILKKVVKVLGLSLVFLLLVMLILPYVFSDTITEKVKQYANSKLNSELYFSETSLSFFKHFPSLTVSLEDVVLKGSAPFEKDTLIQSKEIGFGVDILSVFFNEKINIDKIYIENGQIAITINSKGQPNYNVYISDEALPDVESEPASLKLSRIEIKNTDLIYNDLATKMYIKANGFNYVGKGDLNKSVFDLASNAKINAFDFTYDGEQYLKQKSVNAKLITKINTESLSFFFQENNLKINKLPVDFKGAIHFLKNGYSLDFKVVSENSNLNDFFTALPPQFITWLDKTKIKGRTDLLFSLKGDYIASENKNPDLHFNMKVREGFISSKESPYPVENVFLNFDTKLPSLNFEALQLKIDSIYFDVGKDFFNGNVITKGLKNPVIDAKIRSNLDLEKLNIALGIDGLHLKGLLKADVTSRGIYNAEDSKFPITKGELLIKDGFIKTKYYPNPIQNINIQSTIENISQDFKDASLIISKGTFEFENQPFDVVASFVNFEDINYNVKAKGTIDVQKIYKVFSQEGLNLEGFIKADVSFSGKQSDASNGNYEKLNNKGTLYLKDIQTSTAYLPKPFLIKEGLFQFNQDQMSFDEFKANYGTSDFLMNGYLENVINFVLSDKAILKGNFDLKSNFINLNEFVPVNNSVADENDSITSGVIIIPSNFDLKFNASVQKIKYDELIIDNLKGSIAIHQSKIGVQNTGFELIGTKVNLNGLYYNENEERAHFDFKMNAVDFDIKRAYNEISLFKEIASAAEYAEGIVSLDYKLSGKLDNTMSPILPSLIGGGTLSVKNVKMKGFKLFNVVSQKTETGALNDPDISKVDIKTTIKNNLIKIERFKFKVAGFRPRIEGETSLDGDLNLKMRIGLPPLGIIGIPIKVTGTQENPLIKLGSKTEDLEEIEYDEEIKPTEELKTDE
ncbi:AsmA-like C-terminal region-containing protein [Flavobacterium orientale]|nr:AsmA-like C-terminal region-containing protein [Flavobacterium orientale]